MRLLVEDVTIHAYTHHVQGELSRDKLLALAQRRYSSVQEHLRNRRTRLQEYGDYRLLQTWLLAVRGVQLKEPLKLAVPPLVGDRTDSWTNSLVPRPCGSGLGTRLMNKQHYTDSHILFNHLQTWWCSIAFFKMKSNLSNKLCKWWPTIP